MINLLPPDVKENIKYARRNTRLRQWIVVFLFCIIGIAGTVGVGQLYLQQSINSYTAQVKQGKEDLEKQNLEGTQKQVQDLTDSLKLVTQVLQREILFSKLLVQIGSSLPNGSVLSSLSINKVQVGLDLQAAAQDYHTATQVQLNLQDPKNKIFEKADIVNIQCAAAENSTIPVNNLYPCTIQIRSLFAKNNSFSFVGGSTKQ